MWYDKVAYMKRKTTTKEDEVVWKEIKQGYEKAQKETLAEMYPDLVKRFEATARKGRKFAKLNGITRAQVLRDN